MTGEPTNELIERLRYALVVSHANRHGAPFASCASHACPDAREVLDALAARVTELEAEVERGTRMYVTCHENRMDETARADKAEARVTELEEALREAKRDFNLIRRTITNSRTAPNVFESLADFAKWGEEKVDAALAAAGEGDATEGSQ
jgi:hypothetical protein